MRNQFSTFNYRPQVLGNGQPYWVGGFSSIQGGSTQTRALFFGVDASILLSDGDNVSGMTEVIKGSGIQFETRISEGGNRYITEVLLEANSDLDGLMVVSGVALSLGGSLLREGTLIPTAVDGQNSETWDNFDFYDVNHKGDFMITGNTNGNSRPTNFLPIRAAYSCAKEMK